MYFKHNKFKEALLEATTAVFDENKLLKLIHKQRTQLMIIIISVIHI